MFNVTVHTEIDINAAPARVWSVLADLDRYPEWNPMIRSASGMLRRGSRLTIRFNPPGTRGTTFRPKLLAVEPVRELRWQGQPGFPLLFESEHIFLIRECRDRVPPDARHALLRAPGPAREGQDRAVCGGPLYTYEQRAERTRGKYNDNEKLTVNS